MKLDRRRRLEPRSQKGTEGLDQVDAPTAIVIRTRCAPRSRAAQIDRVHMSTEDRDRAIGSLGARDLCNDRALNPRMRKRSHRRPAGRVQPRDL